jgi:type VI secretion system protein ImpA
MVALASAVDVPISATSMRLEVAADQPPALDPAIAALCAPLSPTDPCGPDLDLEGDADYLNFFAQVEGILPTAFFSTEDGRPFDPSTIDIQGQLASIKPLLARTHDIRLLLVQARLLVLNRDLSGFATNLEAIAELLDRFWDAVHPRPQQGDLDARQFVISALDLPTVVFTLQYAPLFEARRTGSITYRGWMIATGEVKPRDGESTLAAAAMTEAVSETEPTVLAPMRQYLGLIKTSLDRIRKAFTAHGATAELERLPALVGKMLAFVDPHAAAVATAAEAEHRHTDEGPAPPMGRNSPPAGPAPDSLAAATAALAAVADYYSRSEPSSPTLPLVRQAHQLIGKSFLEVMTILMPSQVEKAAFQIGTEQVFDLPVGKLPSLPQIVVAQDQPSDGASPAAEPSRYRVDSRAQAVALLDQVQRYFRHSEPSSPVPMLCERARTLAERDFMGVLRDVLPKSALKNIGSDK